MYVGASFDGGGSSHKMGVGLITQVVWSYIVECVPFSSKCKNSAKIRCLRVPLEAY